MWEEEKETVLKANKVKYEDVESSFLKKVSILPFEIHIPVE